MRLGKTATFRRLKRVLKQLTGREARIFPQVKNCPMERIGGWMFCPTAVPNGARVYSFGVEENVDIDRHLVERFSATVSAFDPTPNTVQWATEGRLPAGIRFFPIGIAGRDGRVRFYPRVSRKGDVSKSMYTTVPGAGSTERYIEVEMRRLRTLMSDLGHDRIDVLKMDIEGAEYDVIDDIVSLEHPFKQILIEFHHRFESIGVQRTVEAVAKLNAAGYRIFFISDTGREYSFIHEHALC